MKEQWHGQLRGHVDDTDRRLVAELTRIGRLSVKSLADRLALDQLEGIPDVL